MALQPGQANKRRRCSNFAAIERQQRVFKWHDQDPDVFFFGVESVNAAKPDAFCPGTIHRRVFCKDSGRQKHFTNLAKIGNMAVCLFLSLAYRYRLRLFPRLDAAGNAFDEPGLCSAGK